MTGGEGRGGEEKGGEKRKGEERRGSSNIRDTVEGWEGMTGY